MNERKKGPKPSGVKKKVFYARVTEDVYDALTLFHQSGSKPMRATEAVLHLAQPQITPKAKEPTQDKNIRALLDDVESKAKEIESLKGRIDKISRMTEDERCARWIAKYDEMAARLAKIESDGS